MGKLICPFLFLFLSLGISAQTSVRGIVIDKENKRPIADVIVQYGATSKDYVLTDEEGRYIVPEASGDIIYFQCIGYKPTSAPKTVLLKSPLIELELNPFSLTPIIISPMRADKMLNEAMLNTKKNLLTGQPIAYLLHFFQKTDGSNQQNEIYLKYAATLSERALKKELKDEKIPYVFNLIDIATLQKENVPVSDLYGAEYHASHLFTFGKSENNETTLTYTPDSSLVLLDIKPLKGKGGWARGQIKINREDMAVVSIEIESVDSVLEQLPFKKYLDKRYKIVAKTGRFEFKKRDGKYYMTDCFTFYRFRNIDEFNRQEDLEYYCDVTPVGFMNKASIKKRELSGYCQELFYLPDTTKDEFWNDPKEDMDSPDVAKLEKPSKGKRKRNVLRALKSAAGIVPIVGMMLLIK